MQPGGWWEQIAKDIPRTKSNVTKGFLSNWLAGIAFIFGATFAIGNLIFGNWGNGILLTSNLNSWICMDMEKNNRKIGY